MRNRPWPNLAVPQILIGEQEAGPTGLVLKRKQKAGEKIEKHLLN
jgi:hypothetical protein